MKITNLKGKISAMLVSVGLLAPSAAYWTLSKCRSRESTFQDKTRPGVKGIEMALPADHPKVPRRVTGALISLTSSRR